MSSEVSSLSASSQLDPEARPFVLDSIREEEPPASPSNSTDDALHGDAFAAAFGRPGENVEEECHRLERNRRQALAQGLEESYERVPGSSALTKHLWSHYKELPHFATSLELYAHARKNITVEILFTAPQISLKKSYRTKDCRLCMAEKQHLFLAFGKQKRNQQRNNLMNVKTEMYGGMQLYDGVLTAMFHWE